MLCYLISHHHKPDQTNRAEQKRMNLAADKDVEDNQDSEKINFLQETHEKGQIHAPSPNPAQVCAIMEMKHIMWEYVTTLWSRYTPIITVAARINKKKSNASKMSKDRYKKTCGQTSKRKKLMIDSDSNVL
ncbi:hypothetical protein L1987_60305 [Smallanthus sonchifolius]|uniref:Uncharacterized protein n=1 Tax=Smallanthus sonchifolius TaxID=185202 RepID=A0ACB9D8H2_9ASTR|nr:hypothetical protein L1987_60305 [Smallanthus sonchifolius]